MSHIVSLLVNRITWHFLIIVQKYAQNLLWVHLGPWIPVSRPVLMDFLFRPVCSDEGLTLRSHRMCLLVIKTATLCLCVTHTHTNRCLWTPLFFKSPRLTHCVTHGKQNTFICSLTPASVGKFLKFLWFSPPIVHISLPHFPLGGWQVSVFYKLKGIET